jgi:GNAT superfamily N-acetyltransferase
VHPSLPAVLRTISVGVPQVITHTRLGPIGIGPVEPERTYGLRHQVLRPHQQVSEMGWMDSDDPKALVVAATTGDGQVVATGAVRPERSPAALGTLLEPTVVGDQPPAWRLRAMATRPDLTGTGLGAAVLGELVGHVAALGGGLLWCTARIRAVPFYERAGLRTAGTVWDAEGIGPHIHMWRVVEGASTVGDPAD